MTMASDRAPAGALPWIPALLIGAAAAAAAALALARLAAPGAGLAAGLAALGSTSPALAALVIAAPLVAAFLAALAAGRGAPAAPARAAVEDAAAAAVPATGEEGLTLLALLQQEGRFVDFVEEELEPYSDAQIGAAVRAIHSGCRAALRERLELAPILPGEEGATVTVERGFDPEAVRVSGNVRGEPPYRGVLRHPGWRAGRLTLPARTGGRDVSILAPAEVEVP
jgi:hypothetical protein